MRSVIFKLPKLFLLVSFLVAATRACDYKPYNYEFQLNSGAKLELNYLYPQGLTFSITRGNTVVHSATSADNLSANIRTSSTTSTATFSGNGNSVTFSIVRNDATYSEIRIVRNLMRGQVSRDCIKMEEGVQWFGGPQQKTQQFWPVNAQRYTEYSYITKEADSNAIAERYWFNSNGGLIYVEPEAPLFVSQSSVDLCFKADKKSPYNTDLRPFVFAYRIGVAADAKEAHLKAIERFLGKPMDKPDLSMTEKPIWSTWARYKRDVDEVVVEEFAKEIHEKFAGLEGQYELDDKWEPCYGALTVDKNKFSDLKALITKIKGTYGFERVTMWIHPFVNKDCDKAYKEGLENGYFVLNATGSPDTEWWNSKTGEAAYIDFTNPEATDWFLNRLLKLQEDTGVDSFKFDAGEASWAPDNPQLYGNRAFNPNILTTKYIEAVSKKYIARGKAKFADFKNLIEVRSGFKNQDIPVFMRMIDKDTYFDYNNGLPTLVTTLLQLNMAGYPFVLPDMVGGNGYNEPPSPELFIRWLQANVFMPSIQFSYVPWDFTDPSVLTQSTAMVQLHIAQKDIIKAAFEKAVLDGTPVNQPIWWIDPTDPKALACGDEFLLGNILVAPILEQGKTSRTVYLPKGTWVDGNDATRTLQGAQSIDYQAPIDKLPYFIKSA